MAQPDAVQSITQNGSAIVLWLTCGTSVYFLKQFADSVHAMRHELQRLREYVARIGQQVGVFEHERES